LPFKIDDEFENESLMPIYWTIDSKARLTTVVAEGEVSLADAMSLLDAMSGAKVLAYRKLFDGRTATTSMGADDLLTVCAKIRSYHTQGTMGALAMIATADQTVVFARVLGALAAAERPTKLFDNPRQARLWIDAQADG